MTVEDLIASLSPEDKRNALELLWQSIDHDSPLYSPPEWHGEILADRLENPSKEPSLPLDAAMKEVRRRVDERRASS
jgi:hypothetical protein